MKNLNKFLEQQNAWGSIFKQPLLEVTSAQGRARVAAKIEAKLSPENLSCDGELPTAQVRKMHSYLIACAKELVAIDPSIKFYELS